MSETVPSKVSADPLKRVSCLPIVVAIFAATAFLGVLVYNGVRQEAAEHERNRQRSILDEFQRVKQGDTSATIWSPELATMLAEEGICVRTVREIGLFMVDLDSPGFTDVRRLKNVTSIYIYSCEGVDGFLTSLDGMPSLTELHLEANPYTEQTPQAIASLPNLKSVRIDRLLSEAQIESLLRALPSSTTVETYDDTEKWQRRQGSRP